MTIRTNILNTISSDLLNIQSSNGYYNSIQYVKSGVLLPEQISVYPSAGFIINSDELIGYNTEDLKMEVRKLDIMICIYVNEENKSLAIENMIDDLNKLFKNDISIQPEHQSQIKNIDGIWTDKEHNYVNVNKITQIYEAGIIIYEISIYYLV